MSQTHFPEHPLPFPRGCPLLGASPAGAMWHILAMLAQWEQCQLPKHSVCLQFPWPLAHGDRDLGSLVTAGSLGLEQNAVAGWIFSGGEMIWGEEGHCCELFATSSGSMA